MAKSVEFACSGHPSITGTHRKTLEFTRDSEISPRATCIIGVGGDWNDRTLRSLRGQIRVEIEIGSEHYSFEATVSETPDTTSLIFRRGVGFSSKTYAYQSTVGAAGIDRALLKELRDPDSTVTVRIHEIGYSRPARGVLHIVALPIGDFADLSSRARKVIERADLVLAEDTRRFRVFARETNISFGTLWSYHDTNERSRVPEIIAMLESGSHVALVSDAGTPVINDPGLLLLRQAVERSMHITPVPGPSAPIAALMVAGIPADQFLFVGFPPKTRSRRRARLAQLSTHKTTILFFEAPHRLTAFLEDLGELLPHRELMIGRELTKIHEQLIHTTTNESLAALGDVEPRGEYTLVVGPPLAQPSNNQVELDDSIQHLVSLLRDHLPTRVLAQAISKATGMSRREAYDLALGRSVEH